MEEISQMENLKVCEEEPPNFETPVSVGSSESELVQPPVNEEEALKKANELKVEGNALFAAHQYTEAAGFVVSHNSFNLLIIN
jgi:hypothetical protein